MRNKSDKCCRENPMLGLYLITFSRKSWCLLDNAEKYATDGKATCDNIIRHKRWACCIYKAAHTHTHTHTYIYTHTHNQNVYRTYFSAATMLKLTRFIVAFYVHRMSVFFISSVFIAITNTSIGSHKGKS